jgi:hypothetical protein
LKHPISPWVNIEQTSFLDNTSHILLGEINQGLATQDTSTTGVITLFLQRMLC